MRHTESHFRHALFALQGADGYVEALLEMARDQVAGQRSSGSADRFGNKLKSVQFEARKILRRN